MKKEYNIIVKDVLPEERKPFSKYYDKKKKELKEGILEEKMEIMEINEETESVRQESEVISNEPTLAEN